ncbi:MAG: NAD(P)-dependent oxidoreductase [Candidatus Geothermarchaeales archaeon]
MKTGFIGIGVMGRPIAKNLLKAGFELTVYDVDEEAVHHLTSIGAREADSPRHVAEASEAILTCLPSSEALEEAVLGRRGVLEGAMTGSTIIDLGTTDPGTIRKIAGYAEEKGVEVLDAPVSGGPEGAEAGTLTVMVGGKREVYDRCAEILGSVGKNVYYLGGLGCGATAKIVNNLMSMCNTAAMVEGFALGVKAGVDAKTLYEVVKKSTGYSLNLDRRWARRIARGDYDWGFRIDLVRKDLGLALKMGREMGIPLFMTETADQVFALGQAKGLGEKDASAIALFFEELLGIDLGETTGNA